MQKIDELRDRVYHNGYDIVGVVETWRTHSGIADAEMATDGFEMYRVDWIGQKGGGVILYVMKFCLRIVFGHTI